MHALGQRAVAAILLLVPAVPAVAGLIVVIVLRPSWNLVTGLAWVCAIVLVPGFVVVIETWGTDFNC